MKMKENIIFLKEEVNKDHWKNKDVKTYFYQSDSPLNILARVTLTLHVQNTE